MESILPVVLLLTVGFVSGFINVMAGGGSALTLPALIFLGLDGSLANGTNRIAILIQNISGVAAFKQEKYYDFKKSMKLSLWTLPGSVLGAFYATKISNDTFNFVLGVIMIFVVLTMVVPTKRLENLIEKEVNYVSYLIMLGIGFYGGFIQVGIGFILMAFLHNYLHMKMIYVNMHKLFIVLVLTIPALLIFMFSGNVNYFLGIVLAIGNAVGAWASAKLNVKKGDKIVKYVLILSIIIMSFKLFGIF